MIPQSYPSVAEGAAPSTAVSAEGAAPEHGKQHWPCATIAADGNHQVFTIPFGGDVSGCVATANPTAATADTDAPLIVATAGNPSRVVVTQQDAATPYAFALQVIC